MPLNVGSRLGHYDVTALIGEGGMGQVYQATDTKLNRQVALKILPEAFASDPDRLARFQREAQVLASLNHPGIAAIYGLEESDDTRALVLELVEGPTLADRIAQGPIPIDEALPIAKQIAEALEAAHEAGVIHRDLKPANIKVKEDGTVKVLDFGLAKAFDPSPEGDPSQSPTVTAVATATGVILGTAAYMSPEQARGRPVDKRSDIWAFGAVLYEMVTGKRPFEGRDVSETLGGVLRLDPDWKVLPDDTPPRVTTLLRRCLEKEPKQRVHDIADVRLAMEGAFETATNASQSGVPQPAKRQQGLPLALGLAAVVAIITAVTVWSILGGGPAPIVRFPIALPASDQFTGTESHLIALSPDGSQLVYVANEQLYLRAMDELEATAIRGTEGGASAPFFSPDGQWVGFWQGSQLKKVLVTGGPVALLCDGLPSESIRGTSWGADDTILFGLGRAGIWQVPSTGGTPEQLITMDEGGVAHGPQRLPGGEWVLFSVAAANALWEDAQVIAQSLVTGEQTLLFEGGRDARYVATGHIVYGREGTLFAVPVDLSEPAVRGGPVPLLAGVMVSTSENQAAMQFSVSAEGSLAYVSGTSVLSRGALEWVDRAGSATPASTTPRTTTVVRLRYPALAPDDRSAALEVQDADGGRDIWIEEFERGAFDQLTFEGDNRVPVWTPDGGHVAFGSRRAESDEFDLYWKSSDGSGDTERLLSKEYGQYPQSWSPDGQTLAFYETPPLTQRDIWVLRKGGVPEPFIVTEANESGAAFSPDGQWLAYRSDESGENEVYVQPFPGPGGKRLVSSSGGFSPRWSADGRVLFYRALGGTVMAVPVETEPVFMAGTPQSLSSSQHRENTPIPTYDVASDGERFLMIADAAPTDTEARKINVVLNWAEELTRLVPTE